MKYGVLDFSYAHFAHFEQALRETGCYTVNLGDCAQSIAAREVYRALGVSDSDMVSIDRDTLDAYDGPEAVLLMNAVFSEPNFPVSPLIRPLFVGFSALESTIVRHREWLRQFAPIGARDPHVARLLQQHGVEATTTGCVTLTLPRRERVPDEPKLFVVFGSGAGALPPEVLKHIPASMADTAEFLFHRAPVGVYPVPEPQRRGLEAYERHLLQQLRDRATLVLTPLHHVAAPCMAMGIPVIICRQDLDPRFSLLSDFAPVHTPATAHAIDWCPAPIDMSRHRREFIATVADLLARVRGRHAQA